MTIDGSHSAPGPQTGVMFPCRLPAGDLVDFARASESAGIDQLWVVEDAFFGGGIATAATALAATSRIVVGVGIVPAAVRNVAYLAMEVATLAALYPGRLEFGVGHGMLDWLGQVGAEPDSPLTLLDETLEALRALLRGERITRAGRYVQLEDVELAFPPSVVPPVLAGVRGPRSVELAARRADGTILAEPVSAPYLASAARDGHRLVAYSWFLPGSDVRDTRPRARALLARTLTPVNRPHLVPLLGPTRTDALLDAPDEPARTELLDDPTVDALVVHGSTTDSADAIKRLGVSGPDTVVLIPPPGEEHTAVSAAGVITAELRRRTGPAHER
ncbi:LLM class flavin-dependent oxidoreductase [Actinomycetospora termitidis]|uniref:LLM class flavin-dependent oxidoreductase n=1 Tax=Actinomycetospora termitidis TaxID=3053470 RepID=A0ABT7MG84_9PSEU|nr:LLM class flavin-dependent oxidoreductase [Actinomycetospora sp. Odt1-22]MDL5159681.1 LLM class flavin-dependent oxidoreductase [Actinomycetospora sp. Odt1-22]